MIPNKKTDDQEEPIDPMKEEAPDDVGGTNGDVESHDAEEDAEAGPKPDDD